MPSGEHPFDEEIILNKNKNKNKHGNAVPNYHTFVEVSGCGVEKSNGLNLRAKQ